MSAIDETFIDLRANNKKAFVPFVAAGDPDLEFTRAALLALDEAGATICEVGVPYSDPIADGPVIQASYTRALARGFTVDQMLQTLGGLATEMSAPRVTMISYSIVHRYGAMRYLEEAHQAGVAGFIVPDLPVEESSKVASLCRARGLSLIQLVTPTTSEKRAAQIVSESTGFIYCVSVTGITGERSTLPDDLVSRIEWIRQKTDTPICVGFGISSPDHVRKVAPLADGVIVGSAFVKRIAQIDESSRDQVLSNLRDFASSMIAELD